MICPLPLALDPCAESRDVDQNLAAYAPNVRVQAVLFAVEYMPTNGRFAKGVFNLGQFLWGCPFGLR